MNLYFLYMVVPKLSTGCRAVPFITLSELRPRIWITLAGCNFRCKGCFSIARDPVGELMSVEQLVTLVKNSSRAYYGDTPLEEVVLTGGEPTLDRGYLVDLVARLKEFVGGVVLDTNGYLLDEDYLQELIAAGLTEVMFDLKAWDEKLHEWYTGYSNRRILENIRTAYGKVKLVVNTVYIPGIVDEREIERIAQFLAELDAKKEIDYRINRFRAELSHEKIARNPEPEELERAYSLVARHMKNSVIGKSCVRERRIEEKRGWITVFPDGTMKRRTLDDYRAENKHLGSERGSHE
ncbi:MAG: radical SAM protein [Methanophagales archaeon ANME-1-THS]|nr:MAG: radical SAM protein [Methanophagales archaeon ANME-1-THS]